MIKKIVATVEEILPKIRALRHRIHRNPELAGKEFVTAALVRETLKNSSLELLPPFLETDVVGMLQGSAGTGGNVTLRADMDALPLVEANDVEYVSSVPGCMHACGHDGHTAMLLGAALVLDKLKSEIFGSVRFVFQPGEEVAALGRKLVDAGALLNPEPELVFALHGYNNAPIGTIAAKPGPMMAAAGFFSITIKGNGGHGSTPHNTISPLLTACRIVEALQSIPSGMIDAQDPVVVSVCQLNSGTSSNIVPAEAVIEGTVRFLDNQVGEKVAKLIKQIAESSCAITGAKCGVIYELPYRPTINDPASVQFAKRVVKTYLGEEFWVDLTKPSMGGEDFCYYLEQYPGVFCRLGLGAETKGLHHPEFNFNDDSLRNGIITLVAMAIEKR